RIEGLFGDDRTFAEVGITRVNLGDKARIEHIDEAKTDRFGNRLMRQAGATFVVDGLVREYADIWFAVWARSTTTVDARSQGIRANA
ncbi:MAG: hypothetical protein ACO3JL_08170, partial [Myxococcota bacterium]